MDGRITIRYLQEYLKRKDYHPEASERYFLKLVEETGELARALHKGLVSNRPGQVKDTVDEELWDIMYYVIGLANCFGIDLELVIPEKEAINNAKYDSGVQFELDR